MSGKNYAKTSQYFDCDCIGGQVYTECPSCLGQPRLREKCKRCKGAGCTWTPCQVCTGGYGRSAGPALPDATCDSGHSNWHDHSHGHGQGSGSSGRSTTRH